MRATLSEPTRERERGSIAERLRARHLILQHALGQCMYVCMYVRPSRSSTHARELLNFERRRDTHVYVRRRACPTRAWDGWQR